MRRLSIVVSFVVTFVVTALASASLSAQDSTAIKGFGRVTGRVVDSASGLGVVGVGVQVVGTTVGTNSGVDGRFTLLKVPAGPLTILVKRIGFAPKQVTGLYMNDGQAIEQNVTMGQAVQILAPAVVTAEAERGSVTAALDAQRTSVGILNATTAEQISKSPDANAAQAVQRVSGINLGDNSTVTARGLGDKYTISSLNGARIPSPEPERRIVPLDLFPSGLLQSITTAKTFTPDLQGDFAGALVDIKTREFPAKRMWSAQIGQGYAAGVTGSRLLTGQTVGGERFAVAGSQRDLPELIRYVGNFQGLTLSQDDENLLISQFRNAWTPRGVSAPPNLSGSVSLGGNDPLLFGHRVGYLLSGTLSSGTDLKDNQVRALAGRGTNVGETIEVDRFVGQTTSQSVLWGGILNASTLLGTSTRLTLNTMYNRTADNEARVERGTFEVEAIPVQITRMRYVERGVRSLQLAGEHQLGAHKMDWALTSSGVTRDEPDRSEFIQVIEQDTPGGPEVLRWLTSRGAVRTFSALSEHSNEGRGSYAWNFGPSERPHVLTVGGLYRVTDRDASNREYSIYSTTATTAVRSLPADQLFDGRNTEVGDSVFHIVPLGQGGNYSANDRLLATYGMVQYGVTDRVRVIAGARIEQDRVRVDAQSTLGTPVVVTKRWNDVLPSLTVNVQLTNNQQIRFAASKTLARPEYRELTPITTREVLNGVDTQGNEDLERTSVFNIDTRWEWYASEAEVLSVAVFAKRFDQPIERMYRATSSANTVFFANALRADNYGIEVEWRRRLGSLGSALEPFTYFTNLTLMNSAITLDTASQTSATNFKRRMVGQAPYVFNAGLTYATPSGLTSATLLYNRVGERIDAAGEMPLPDVVQEARDGLDFSLRFPIVGAWSGRFDAKNLLDNPVRTVQGTVVREQYRIGRVIQAGVVWKP
ncbi:MAG TPA: TonB-dependent receptor [Gemmatimonadaceae bacterium]|nr:TonB-dependent receptor [Gemmatimonadaceae bacterium]